MKDDRALHSEELFPYLRHLIGVSPLLDRIVHSLCVYEDEVLLHSEYLHLRGHPGACMNCLSRSLSRYSSISSDVAVEIKSHMFLCVEDQ